MSEPKVIVSLTSHTKERLKLVPYYLYHSIIKYKFNDVKIVLTLYKDDLVNIPDYLQILIDTGYVELIVADENLGPHLKYFYVMQKYRNLPIITIDDDTIYPEYMINLYMEEYKKNPNIIICRSAREITFNGNKVNPFSKWSDKPSFYGPSHRLHAEGYCGILYPPNCLNISNDLIPEIKTIFRADDIYLSILEIRNKIPVVYLVKYGHQLNLSTKGFAALSCMNDLWQKSDEYVKLFEKEFI